MTQESIIEIFPTGIYSELLNRFDKKIALEHASNYYKNILKTHPTIKPTLVGFKNIETKSNREYYKNYNSYLSGIFFQEVDENDKIHFLKTKYKHIKPHVSNYNLYNSEAWWFNIRSNEIMLFPSYLNYDFENVTGGLKKFTVFQIMFEGIGTSKIMETIDKGEGIMI
tara:strand:+ start:2429 stop:2932 length:504 start_codon:yes stop_codon:yes gene_type:complete